MFDDLEFLICNLRHVPGLGKSLFFISMFGDLDYYVRVKHVVLMISQGGVTMAKGSKISGLYILDGFNVIGHSPLASEEFYDKNKLWDLRLRRGRCVKVMLDHLNEIYKTLNENAFGHFYHNAES